MLLPRIPGHFYAKAEVAGVSCVYDLPGDVGVISEVRDSDGLKVIPISVAGIKDRDGTGDGNEYYRTGANKITLNKDGATETLTIYYRKKCRDISFGQATAGAATSITLATTASKLAGFYNGMDIANITQDWQDTITGYDTSRVATILETAAASDWYGLVPEIPEPFHHLISTKAVHLIKASYPMAQERPTAAELQIWEQTFAEIIRAYGNESDDISPESVFEGY